LFFSKFRPFRGVPAGILLLTSGVAFFFAASLAAAFKLPGAAGVRGSLRGCAEVVDVAEGGGVALERRDDVVRKRCGCVIDVRAREAARRQLRQIMTGSCGGQLTLLLSHTAWMLVAKSLAWGSRCAAELFLRDPMR
jgi:hypothetical protein